MRKVFLLLIILFTSVVNLSAQTQVEVSGDISTNTTWTANNNYLLNGFVHVVDGVTLTIEAGTTVYGKIGTKASLIVRKGGKLNA
ncbi:MAG: T9SS C-terminal target domain-containing protein, partial [Ignavibacteriaceae bacterium]